MTNENLSLVNKVLVLKRDGENLQLPAERYLVGKTPLDLPPAQYLMFRVSKFDEETGELWLKYESGNCDARAFEISKEVNSDTLLSSNIQKVIIINRYSNAYV